MSKRKTCFIKLIVFVFYFFSIPYKTFSQIKKTNIIFILTDDQRWYALGHEENKLIHMLKMDKIFEEGTFKNVFSSTQEKLNLNEGDLCDSKQMRGNRSVNIVYQGKTLRPDKNYSRKVWIEGSSNRTSDYSVSQSSKITSDPTVYPNLVIFQIDTIKPKVFKKENNQSSFIDFGRDAFATLALNYSAKKADTITFKLGEQLAADGTINSKPKGNIRYQEVRLAVNPEHTKYQISLKPDKRNTKPDAAPLPKSFPVLMPFRYVEIDGNNQTIERNQISQLAYHTYFDDSASSFSCSNPVLNQIWGLCKYTIKATSFTGLYVDGDRERIPYEADAYINQLGAYATNRDYNIAKNTIEYLMKHPTWPTEWQLYVAMMVYQDYMYTGSKKLIKKYYRLLKYKSLMELVGRNGLISTKSPKLTKVFMKKLGFKDTSAVLKDIVDWPPAQKDTKWKLATPEGARDGFVFMPYNTVVNCLYYKNMKIMAEFANILHKPREETMFNLKALKAKQAINQKMVDKKSGIYVDGIGTTHSSLHANMFALAFNLVPKNHIKTVVDFIKSRGMACSVYGSQYLMEALYNGHAADYALKLMTSKSDRSWYNMIRSGATMTMEAWDMKYKPNSDWNHAWGAVPANVIPRLMWGIQPETAGGSVVEIKPQLASLKESKIKVPFLKGEVCASYKKTGRNHQEYTFDIPTNMSTDLKLNCTKNDTVILNGETVKHAFRSMRLNSGVNKIELIINTSSLTD